MKIEFESGGETIRGKVLGNSPESLSDFVVFHGAGASTKERVKKLFDKSVFEQISSIVTFDFSGHGESTGVLEESNLAKRVSEARKAIELYTTKENLTICGLSMGGYIAIKMLEFYDIKNLILFAPAVYDKRSFDVPFGQGFTEIIRTPKSYLNSDAMAIIGRFKGHLLIIIGKEDEVIPEDVTDLIYSAAHGAKSKEIIYFDGCTHAIHDWFEDHSAEKRMIAGKVMELYS